MAINITRPNGTEDILPSEVHKWHTVEKIARETAETYGFNEIRIPTFENTNLKILKIGDLVNIETDILGKYVEKFLSANDNKESQLSMSFLQENGFV